MERSNYKGKQLTLPTAKKGMQPDGTNHIFFQQEHPWVFDVSLTLCHMQSSLQSPDLLG